MLTPDAQLITALGGTEDVDPDEHIRAFKHTHTGEHSATALLAVHHEAPLMARQGGGFEMSLQGRRVTLILLLFEPDSV